MSIQPSGSAPGATPTTAPGTAARTSPGRADLGRDDFLKLLVAQLRYQDPLNPADGTEFVAQTAQLTNVEKLGQLADTSDRALAMQLRWSAAGLVGRTVTHAAADGTPATGRVVSVGLTGDQPVLRVASGDPASPGTRDVPLDTVTSVAAPAA